MKTFVITFVIILQCVVLCSSVRVLNENETISMVQNFSVRLFLEVLKGKEGLNNTIMSPLGLFHILNIVRQSSGGSTKSQIGKALFSSSNYTNSSINVLLGHWKSYSQGVERRVNVSFATGLFVDQHFTLKPSYLQFVNKFHDIVVQQETFIFDPNGARERINRWVEQQTNHKIREFLQYGAVDQLTKMILVNAIHFKGEWLQKFDKKRTYKSPFYCLNPSQKNMVETMELETKLKYQRSSDLQSTIVWLPFSDSRTQMVVILPNNPNNLLELQKIIQSSVFSTLRDGQAHYEKVRLRIPKLKIESQLSLKSTLQQSFGIQDLFVAGKADLSSMSYYSYGMYASDVLHKAVFEMNEEGAEASASSGIKMRLFSGIPTIRIDRPFLFLILDEKRIPLFIGRVTCLK